MSRRRGFLEAAPIPAVAPSLCALGLALLVLASGCVGGIPHRELPENAIAFRYRTPEEARRRAEKLQDEARAQREAGSGPARARARRGGRNDIVASTDDFNKILSGILGDSQSERREFPGRLALLIPQTGAVEVISGARPGSLPLAWSQDRRRLLYAQPGRNDFQIHEYDRDQRTVRPVTQGPWAHTQACYGPEGRVVVARVDAQSSPLRSFIAISEPGGRGPYTPISDGPADHSPTCAPGGSAVAYVREPEPVRAEILLRSPVLDGASRRVSPGRHPSFSADGGWIVFAAPYQREQRIWRVRPDGTGRAPIGRGVRSEARPTLSPDGRLVAYVASEISLRRHLYLRRFDGSGDRILFADGDGEFPVW